MAIAYSSVNTHVRTANRRWPWLIMLSAVLIASALAAGAVKLQWPVLTEGSLQAVQHWLGLADAPSAVHSSQLYVFWYMRLPRVLFALLAGAALGYSGALCQGLFRNPLADPGLLGVTTGAACAAALSIVLAGSLPWSLSPALRGWLLPVAAFSGALITCLLLDAVARWLTPGSVTGLLLTGIAMNALAAAIIGICTYLSTDEQLRNLSFWTLGSLSAASWPALIALSIILLLSLQRLKRTAQALNAMSLGAQTAAHSGVNIAALRWRVILTVAILTGVVIAWCGAIGFIGLIAAHLVRMQYGADQRIVLPGAMLSGALVLLLADTLARTLALPAEIPVGILTALCGSPVLLMLLYQSRHRLY